MTNLASNDTISRNMEFEIRLRSEKGHAGSTSVALGFACFAFVGSVWLSAYNYDNKISDFENDIKALQTQSTADNLQNIQLSDTTQIVVGTPTP